MKRFFSLLLTLCLLIPAMVFAEEEPVVFSWEDVKDAAEASGGKFVQLAEVPYEFWLADSVKAVDPYITNSFACYGGFVLDASQFIPDAEEGYDYSCAVSFNLYMLSPDVLRNHTFEEVMTNRPNPVSPCTVNGVAAFSRKLTVDGHTDFIQYYFPLGNEQYMELLIPCYADKMQDGKSVETIWFAEDSEYWTLISHFVSSVRPVE